MPRGLNALQRTEARSQAQDQPRVARPQMAGVEPANAARERRLRAGRVRGGVEQLDELRMRVGRRCRVVDGEKIDALAAPGVERHHQAEKIRIGLEMRTA